MKKNYFLTALIICCLTLFNSQESNAQFTLASDNASDAAYSGGFGSGSNGGSGFSAWVNTYGGSTGTFIGNPSGDGMGATGIGTSAWAFYSTGANYVDAIRTMITGMQFGDQLTFYWAMNYDAGSGSKGFNLKSAGTQVFNINNTGSTAITSTNGAALALYGTDPMLVTLTRISSTEYSFTMTKKAGADVDYSTTIISGLAIDEINIYSGNQNDGAGQKNIYFNNLSVHNDGGFNITSGSETYSKNLIGTGNLSKSGVGTLVLSGTNTYSGTTTVSSGTLILNSSLPNSVVKVNSGSTLQISENTTISSLTVDAGGIVIVDTGKSITITNDLINNGSSFTVNSGSSLFVGGTSTGNVTYNRNLSFISGDLEGWHLVGSPVSGQTYNDAYVTSYSIASGTGSNRGIATYNNGVASVNWTYLQSGGSGTFGTASGYSIKTSETKDISFTGTLNTPPVNKAITIGAGTAYNLISNPFTAPINSETFLDLATNSSKLTAKEIYVWNPSTKNYDTKISTLGYIVSPGQAFFVSCGTAGNLSFESGILSNTAFTFLKSSPKQEIQLNITDGDLTRYAKIYYNENATTSFDNGYDGETFNGIPNKLNVFTQLLTNNQGKNYQIQSLPNTDLESMIIPVGVQAAINKKITFSAEALNLPSEIKVFLEDRTTNTFTRLDEANSEYKITLSEALNGIGRFYLHTSSKSTLNVTNSTLENINIYKTDAATLRIVGLQEGNTNVKLFNLLGKQMMNSSFKSNGVKEISLPQLATGVYFVQVTTDASKLNKKIILK
jgi:autotransporter-associated beta strand protein